MIAKPGKPNKTSMNLPSILEKLFERLFPKTYPNESTVIPIEYQFGFREQHPTREQIRKYWKAKCFDFGCSTRFWLWIWHQS